LPEGAVCALVPGRARRALAATLPAPRDGGLR
jgi:hypothetical protein